MDCETIVVSLECLNKTITKAPNMEAGAPPMWSPLASLSPRSWYGSVSAWHGTVNVIIFNHDK